MTPQVIEVVRFKLNPGVSDADYIAATKGTESFVRGLTGFITRNLSKAEDGTWCDHVIWQDMDCAKAAAKAFPTAKSAQALMGMIDQSTLSMWHETRHWSIAA